MAGPRSLHDHAIPLLEGGHLDFRTLAGKHVLLVNVASACGYTPQYRALQELREHGAGRLEVVGLPCNDFGGQEPGDPATILDFCTTRYGVGFPLTEKVRFQGEDLHPLVRWLTRAEDNGVSDALVTWNFTKFAVSPEGRWLGCFAPSVPPLDEAILHMLHLY